MSAWLASSLSGVFLFGLSIAASTFSSYYRRRSAQDPKLPKKRFIRLINYQDFKACGSIPRFPQCSEIVVSEQEVDDADSFFIFVSHCWLAGWNGVCADGSVIAACADEWRGVPHPDNKKDEKFHLCIEAIDATWKTYASKFSRCYIWFDYGCIDQEQAAADELNMLDKIVERADCILTPIVDHEHGNWDCRSAESLLFEYGAKAWNSGPYAYLNRAWCRMEMFYAANLPLHKCNQSLERRQKFDLALRYAISKDRRPHILYGTKESAKRRSPIVLEPLQNSYLDRLNPSSPSASITKESDRIKVIGLMEKLSLKEANFGYAGSRDANGQKDGFGEEHFEDGTCYTGLYLNGKFHGKGRFEWTAGDDYEGEWVEDEMCGQGTFRACDGCVYEGEWRGSAKNGFGVETLPDGSIYQGYWRNNLKHGKGVDVSIRKGSKYEGDYVNDNRHGYGEYAKGGRLYKGQWENNLMHGEGKETYTNGIYFVGMFEKGHRLSGRCFDAEGNELPDLVVQDPLSPFPSPQRSVKETRQRK